jgi:hypothetical protein
VTTPDDILTRIGRVNQALGGGGVAEYRQGGYTLRHEAAGAPIVRLRPTGNEDRVNVLYWLSKGKWSQVGDFGGVILPLDEALAYVAKNGIFWNWV